MCLILYDDSCYSKVQLSIWVSFLILSTNLGKILYLTCVLFCMMIPVKLKLFLNKGLHVRMSAINDFRLSMMIPVAV